jgi:6,7-dimethyl-8-ribityllumazine synthase
MDLTTSYETPIIFGVLTCNTEEQVLSRIGPHFALAGLNLLVEIGKIEA